MKKNPDFFYWGQFTPNLPITVAYDFHAISSLFHLAFYIRAFAPFELSAPITITHYPGPGGVPIIKLSYYFKPIGNIRCKRFTGLMLAFTLRLGTLTGASPDITRETA